MREKKEHAFVGKRSPTYAISNHRAYIEAQGMLRGDVEIAAKSLGLIGLVATQWERGNLS